VPAIYGVREFATAGGLMSYGTDLAVAPHARQRTQPKLMRKSCS
jgi:hypothetical protein